MKYSQEILINLSREEVIHKFENLENLKHWQKGFIAHKHISGTPGEDGARSKLKYKMGSREIEMIETITKSNLPNEIHLTYDSKGVYNIQKNYFEEEGKNMTRWVSYTEFEFSGFMKAFGFLMPGMFKKQSKKYMDDFKAFAEEGKSVLDK